MTFDKKAKACACKNGGNYLKGKCNCTGGRVDKKNKCVCKAGTAWDETQKKCI